MAKSMWETMTEPAILQTQPTLDQERHRKTALLGALGAVVFWGGSFAATKIVLREVSPVTVVWIRFAMGLPIMGLTLLRRGLWAWPRAREWGLFALLGFLGIAFHQWLQSTGLVTSRATTTGWIIASMPVCIALLGWLVLGEKLRRYQMAGIAVALLGVITVVSQGDFRRLALGRLSAPGDALILLSAPNWAVFSVISRRYLQRYPAVYMLFYVMALGWAMTSVHFLLGPGFSEIPRLSPRGWLSLLFLGPICSGWAYTLWYGALQVLPASRVGVMLYLEPLVAAALAAALLGEEQTLPLLLGGSVILAGVWMVNRAGGCARKDPA